MGRLWERMIRAAKLDASLYEEVEADRGALGQAPAVVVLASVAAGVGASASGGIGGLLLGTIAALAGWYIWAFLTYWIGTRFLPEPQTSANYGELLRTIGFSSAPGMIRAVGVCVIGWIVQVLILAVLLALLRTFGGGLETSKDLTGRLFVVMSI